MKGHTRHVEIPSEAWVLARRPYEIAITHDTESGYIARVAEMPGLVVAEETEEALRSSLEKMMALYITTLMLDGDPVPEPRRVHVS